jgi:hypothetical protein
VLFRSTQQNQQVEQKNQQKPGKPNETGTVNVQDYFRVFDPKTQKTYVEGRA